MSGTASERALTMRPRYLPDVPMTNGRSPVLMRAARALASGLVSILAVATGCGDVTGVGIRAALHDAGPGSFGDAAGDGAGNADGAVSFGPCSRGCSGMTPVCNAATHECVECLVDAHCAGTGKGYCDPVSHECKGCLSSVDCLPGLVCDLARGACVPTCATSSDCSGGICDVALGYCVECLSSSDCTSSERLLCDTQTHRCVQCTVNSDCSGAACNTLSGLCVDCTATFACPSGQVCDLSIADCVASCRSDTECPGETPFCVTDVGLCVQCLTSANCRDPAAPVCSPVTHRCYECLSNSDCIDPDRSVCLVREHHCAQCAEDSDCPAGLRCDVALARCF